LNLRFVLNVAKEFFKSGSVTFVRKTFVQKTFARKTFVQKTFVQKTFVEKIVVSPSLENI
jgi:hypothetical protein